VCTKLCCTLCIYRRCYCCIFQMDIHCHISVHLFTQRFNAQHQMRRHLGFGLVTLRGKSTARMASSKTVLRPFWVSAEHSRYLTALMSFASARPWNTKTRSISYMSVQSTSINENIRVSNIKQIRLSTNKKRLRKLRNKTQLK